MEGQRVRGRMLAAATVVALVGAGLISSVIDDAVAASGRAPERFAAGIDERTQAAHTLVAHVPHEFRTTCIILGPFGPDTDPPIPDAVIEGEVTGLRCVPDGVDEVTYTEFDSVEAADAYLDYLVDTDSYEGASSEFGDCPSATSYTQGSDDTAGRRFCFRSNTVDSPDLPEGTPVLTWTYEPLRLLMQAWSTDRGDNAVHDFWEEDAGPLQEPDPAGIPPLPTTRSLRRAGKQLLAAIPRDARRDCVVVDSMTPESLQSSYGNRLWIVADVEECFPSRGSQESEYFQLATVRAMNSFFDTKFVSDDPDGDIRVEVGGIPCSGLTGYSVGKKHAGRVSCVFGYGDPDGSEGDAEYATLFWTSIPNRVVATASAPASRVRSLIKWWQDDAGPNVGS